MTERGVSGATVWAKMLTLSVQAWRPAREWKEIGRLKSSLSHSIWRTAHAQGAFYLPPFTEAEMKSQLPW